MDPITAIGALASALQIATELSKLARRLNRYVHTMKYAKIEIESVSSEVAIFARLLSFFDDVVCKIKGTSVGRTIKQKDLDSKILEQSKAALAGVKDLLKNLRPLRNQSASSSWLRLLARFRWSRRKGAVMLLQTQLNTLLEQIKHEKQISPEIKAKIQSLTEEIKTTKEACRKAESRLQEQLHRGETARQPASNFAVAMPDIVGLANEKLEEERQLYEPKPLKRTRGRRDESSSPRERFAYIVPQAPSAPGTSATLNKPREVERPMGIGRLHLPSTPSEIGMGERLMNDGSSVSAWEESSRPPMPLQVPEPSRSEAVVEDGRVNNDAEISIRNERELLPSHTYRLPQREIAVEERKIEDNAEIPNREVERLPPSPHSLRIAGRPIADDSYVSMREEEQNANPEQPREVFIPDDNSSQASSILSWISSMSGQEVSEPGPYVPAVGPPEPRRRPRLRRVDS